MQRQPNRSLLLLAGAIVVLLLVAAAVSQIQFQPGRLYDFVLRPIFTNQPVAVGEANDLSWLQVLLSVITVSLFGFLLITFLVSGKVRREVLMRVLIVIMVVIALSMLSDAIESLPEVDEPVAEQVREEVPAGQNELLELPSYDAIAPEWLIWLASAVIALGASAMVWQWLQRRRQEPDLSNQLADEAQSALRDLEAGGNLADIVLRCYREMTRILSEQQGQTRDSAMTPREFEQQLAQAGIRDEHVQQLTRLFERVRYGPAKADPDQEREASECLAAIVAHYGARS